MDNCEQSIVLTPETLPTQLKELRLRACLTQKQLADKVMITQQCISGIENGRVVPSVRTILTIGRILGVVLLFKPIGGWDWGVK
jgi:DNA-binding XRE family transcriptional regulator